MKTATNTREALIVEALGDVALLLDRVDALTTTIESAHSALSNASSDLGERLTSYQGDITSLTESTKAAAVDHIVRRAAKATQDSIVIQSRAMHAAAKFAFSSQAESHLARQTRTLEHLTRRVGRPWEAWLKHAATAAVAAQGWGPAREPGSGRVGLVIDGAHLVLTDGRPAHELVAVLGTDDVAVFDRPIVLPAAPGTALACALAPSASEHWQSQAPAWLAALGFAPQRLADAPGLVVARTIAMLINEAADAVQQGVCTPQGADTAMRLGVNYPAGPFEWLACWDRREVIDVLDALDAAYRGERYRVSPWLRRGNVNTE